MTNYRVVFFGPDGKQHSEHTYKVKHFRQMDGRHISPNGGVTCLFELDTGFVIVSKCHSKETFSRRKGVLTCLQKSLDSSTKENPLAIVDADFKDNELHVWLAKKNAVAKYWWLQLA